LRIERLQKTKTREKTLYPTEGLRTKKKLKKGHRHFARLREVVGEDELPNFKIIVEKESQLEKIQREKEFKKKSPGALEMFVEREKKMKHPKTFQHGGGFSKKGGKNRAEEKGGLTGVRKNGAEKKVGSPLGGGRQ